MPGKPDRTEIAAGPPPVERQVFCNRTLNLRAMRAIGYDMDYTLVHYHVEAWERASFDHLRRKLGERGWPVEDLAFDPGAFQVGLVIDRQLGNIVKANQFGYVKRAAHGTKMLDFEAQRQTYGEEIVDLSEPRFVFLNTLFSLSETCMYAQLVDRLDAGRIPGALGYSDLYALLKESLDEAHMEGQLKAEILAAPERFVELDPEVPLTLLDQRQAGMKTLLITNSEWPYTRFMMSYVCDRFLPTGQTWRDLFDVVIVGARKPVFFAQTQPAFEVVNDEGLLSPIAGRPQLGRVLLGGHATLVEELLGLSGSQVLYVGDHAYGDVHVSKKLHRWRTALVIRELEQEILAQDAFRPRQTELTRLMEEKAAGEQQLSEERLALQHERPVLQHERRRPSAERRPGRESELQARVERTRARLQKLDDQITPLARASAELFNPRWGLLMRSGNDKSYLARLVERHADIYTSRVSNLRRTTPYAFFRAHRVQMPHDATGGEGSMP